MNISFNRNRTQLNFEGMVGINSVEELPSKKQQFKDYTLTHNDASELIGVIGYDAADYFNSGMISLAEGLCNMCERRYSWATVKLYYSVFYFIRASLATKHYAILQCRSMFRLKLKAGEKPYNTGNPKYYSTHSGTINHFKDVFGRSDKLLSNQIDSIDAYEWMEGVRNIINYREVSFRDPNYLSIWSRYDDSLNNGSIDILLKMLLDDTEYIYCFQEEFAVVAIALKRFQLTIKDFVDSAFIDYIDESRIDYADSILPECARRIGLTNYVRNFQLNQFHTIATSLSDGEQQTMR